MTDVAIPDQGVFGVEGLEDFDQSDMIMPRLSLGANQDAGFVIDNLSGEKHPGDPGIEFIVLGIVKNRILWPEQMGETKEDPMCKSYDFKIGHPDSVNPSRFPWEASGFIAEVPAVGAPVPLLNCADCALKEWGTNPGAQKEAPWCSEQHIYVVLQIINGHHSPAILTLQRSGLKASKAYMSSFARTQTPMFVTTTLLKLAVHKRGTVEYSVPSLVRGPATDPAMYDGFAAQYRSIRTMLQTPRTGDMDDVPVAAPVSNVHTPQNAAPAQPQPTQPAPAPAPAPAQPAPAPAAPPPQDVAPAAAAPIDTTATEVAAPVTQQDQAPIIAAAMNPVDVAPSAQVAQPVQPVTVPADVAPPAVPAQEPVAEVQVAQPVAAPAAQTVTPTKPVSDDDLPF